MRIAVTAQTGEGLAAFFAQHFGHAQYLVMLDADAAEMGGVECLANPFLDGRLSGAAPCADSEAHGHGQQLAGGRTSAARAVTAGAPAGVVRWAIAVPALATAAGQMTPAFVGRLPRHSQCCADLGPGDPDLTGRSHGVVQTRFGLFQRG